jgi:hypothetical protein
MLYAHGGFLIRSFKAPTRRRRLLARLSEVRGVGYAESDSPVLEGLGLTTN